MTPGQYELLAVIPADRARGRSAAFQILTVDRDIANLGVSPTTLPTVRFEFVDTSGHPVTVPEGSVMLRRVDPAAEGNPEVVKDFGGVNLLPGRWEVAIKPGTTYCAVGFEPHESAGRADGWNEFLLPPGLQTAVRFVLPFSPAAIGGTVKNANGDTVAGVPVFVEPYDLDPRKRLEPVRSTSTDSNGRYEIGGLAAGVYRLLASFDYQMPEPAQMDAANAKTVRVEDGSRASLDLEEFVIH
jgi:hypothetical protein